MEPVKYTPEQEERMVNEAYRELLDGYLNSNHRRKVERIRQAFEFAREAHRGVHRRSGEPYILHPIAVARIVSREIGLGSTSICAALLHDVVEDTEYTVEDIEHQFGPKIAQLVDGLTKISGGIFGERASAQAENFRKLLLTMSEDIRVVLIKMADRLHNMRTLGSMAPNKQYKIAGETLYIYAPLAHRLGLFAIKTELEDLSFKYEHPDEYARISELIRQSEARRSAVYNDFSAPITEQLTRMGLRFEAKARLKSVYSIWNKMQAKHIPFEEVYDLYAMRIIFECDDRAQEKAICWQIYSAITDLYRLHPDRTRDWISVPKANGYQALHLTVMGLDGNWVEVQIRSARMDEIAEKGFASHWKYKIGNGDEESELNVWLKTIKDILNDPEPNAIDFLDTLKLNLFASEIVIFTPTGELLTLPANSTVLDVAFTLHTQLGCHCIAGKVNHKLVPLSQRLKSGDQVEVLTSQSQTPKPEWINFLATAKGKTRLRAVLRKELQPIVTRGRKEFDDFISANGLVDSNNLITKVLGIYRLANRQELYLALGRGEIQLDQLNVKQLRNRSGSRGLLSKFFKAVGMGDAATGPDKTADTAPADGTQPPQHLINTKEVYILRDDAGGRNFTLATCCNPMPGDDVLGFIEDDGSVTVHLLDCPRAAVLKATYGPRILATRWAVKDVTFQSVIHIEGLDRQGILNELVNLVSGELSLDIRGLEISTRDKVFACDICVRVPNAETARRLCARIKRVDGVTRATRVK